MSKITCEKIYRDIPLGHRQPFHAGHCAFIHGHNWEIRITFEAKEFDDNGFVVDFGELHYLKEWIDENFDHACAFSTSDPHMDKIKELCELKLIKVLFLENASCEGMAKYIFEIFDAMVRKETKDRVWITRIHLLEDSKNSATYVP
jgi:6-pyruvoyltetrahydropterin/6-carboxytetrahydropterin synthase